MYFFRYGCKSFAVLAQGSLDVAKAIVHAGGIAAVAKAAATQPASGEVAIMPV